MSESTAGNGDGQGHHLDPAVDQREYLDCDEFVELVTAFLDGSLDAERERRFVDHLAMCEGCERYLDQFRETIAGLGHLPPDSLDDDARTTLLAAFRSWRA